MARKKYYLTALHLSEKLSQIRLLAQYDCDLAVRDTRKDNLLHVLARIKDLESEELEAFENEIDIDDLRRRNVKICRNLKGLFPDDILAENKVLKYRQKAQLEDFFF